MFQILRCLLSVYYKSSHARPFYLSCTIGRFELPTSPGRFALSSTPFQRAFLPVLPDADPDSRATFSRGFQRTSGPVWRLSTLLAKAPKRGCMNNNVMKRFDDRHIGFVLLSPTSKASLWFVHCPFPPLFLLVQSRSPIEPLWKLCPRSIYKCPVWHCPISISYATYVSILGLVYMILCIF